MTKKLTLSPSTSRAGARSILARVLDDPRLVAAVRQLPSAALATLIDKVGLEDAGEIVALATPEQLVGVLDADIWRSDRPGADETLDAERFARWLEVLLEAGDRQAADKLVELPYELVAHGFFEQVLVLDMDALGAEMAELDEDDADAIEKSLDGTLCHELDAYRVISRRHDGWDAVLGVLTELDARHHAYLHRLLEQLAAATRALVDDYGDLSEALDDAEVIASDAAADRDDRRAKAGYVALADARSFLKLAERQSPEEVLADTKRDPVTRAWFREVEAQALAPAPAPEAAPLLALIEAASPASAPKKRLPSGASSKRAKVASADAAGAPSDPLGDAMRTLAESAPKIHAERLEELAFVANVVLTAESGGGAKLRPYEAVERAMEVCRRGLTCVIQSKKRGRSQPTAAEVLAEIGCDRLFRIGWRLKDG